MEWSASAKVQAGLAFQVEWVRRQMQLEGIYGHHMSNNTCIQVQIISESISHNYVMTFEASEHCTGPYIRKPQGIVQSMATYS